MRNWHGNLSPFGKWHTSSYGALSAYAAYGLEPPLVFDFIENYYRTGGSASTFDDALNFSRASAATYTDADGVLQTAAAGVPRRGHHIWNGSAWVDEGYLHESEARTNLITYSDMSSGFTEVAMDRLGAQEVGPDGQNSLSLYTVTTATSAHTVSTEFITSTAAAVYTQSIVVKKGTLQYLGLRQYGQENVWATAIFDLNALSVSATGVGASSGTILAANVESLGNGLYRLSLSSSINRTSFIFNVQAHSSGTPTLNTFGGESYTGASETFYAGFAQLEAGSTPSSYIPTAGATVTRAADAMTIPAANLPWPEPVVIGPELVTNGTFDTDTDWTKGVGWTISGGAATNNGTNDHRLTQDIGAVFGRAYQVTFTVTSYTSGIVSASIGSIRAANRLIASGIGTYTALIVASGATGLISFYPEATFIGTIDNISAREINPLAVSIQMEGTMTYADTGEVAAATFVNWVLDSNNEIRIALQTFASDVGQVNFLQDQSGYTQVEVPSAIDAYSPGINVPFNIASRHGSTFINGAVDGVALTEDTTPVALPYLENTDLNLAFDYMGTIKKFRFWSDDLGDSGIALSTATTPVITGIPTIGVS